MTAARITQAVSEVVRQSAAPVHGNAGQIAVETLRGALAPTAYVGQIVVESLRGANTPIAYAGQIVVEALRGAIPPAAYVGQIAVEVLHSSMANSVPATGPPMGSMFILF